MRSWAVCCVFWGESLCALGRFPVWCGVAALPTPIFLIPISYLRSSTAHQDLYVRCLYAVLGGIYLYVCFGAALNATLDLVSKAMVRRTL